MKKTNWIKPAIFPRKGVILLVAAIFSLASFSTGHAQSAMSVSLEHISPDGSGARAARPVRNFWHMFGESMNEKWYAIPRDGGFLAEFREKGIAYKVFYDKKGNWVYTLKEYTEKELPADVRAMVKSVYFDYPIAWVKEVNQSQDVVYLVNISNDQEWKTLRVSDGEMEVVEDFRKP